MNDTPYTNKHLYHEECGNGPPLEFVCAENCRELERAAQQLAAALSGHDTMAVEHSDWQHRATAALRAWKDLNRV